MVLDTSVVDVLNDWKGYDNYDEDKRCYEFVDVGVHGGTTP